MKNILAINFGGIGDEILFLPTLISLKKAFPASSITLALEPRSRGIKDLSEVVDDMIFVDIKNKNKYIELLKLIFTARRGKFDLVISSGASPFIAIILAMTGIKSRYGYDTGALSRILLTEAVTLVKNQYAAKMYHDLIAPVTDIKTELPEIKVQKTTAEHQILIHPGVSKISIQKGIVKTISAEKWVEFIKILRSKGAEIVLTGGPDDDEVIKYIQKSIPEIKTILPTNLLGLAKLIAKSEKFVCSDSAPLHIAVALKTPTYAIFGGTDDKKLIPQNEFVTALKANCNCSLQPCLWEKRLTSCKELSCLNLDLEKCADTILSLK